jgi:hypothetical protein
MLQNLWVVRPLQRLHYSTPLALPYSTPLAQNEEVSILCWLQQLLQRHLQNERCPSYEHIPRIFPVSLSSSRNRSSLAPSVPPSPPHATALLLPPGFCRAPPPSPSLAPTRGPPASSTRGRPPPPRLPASSFSTRGAGRRIQVRRTRRRGLPPSPPPAPARLFHDTQPLVTASATAPAYASSPPDPGPAGRVPSRVVVRSTDGGADDGVDSVPSVVAQLGSGSHSLLSRRNGTGGPRSRAGDEALGGVRGEQILVEENGAGHLPPPCHSTAGGGREARAERDGGSTTTLSVARRERETAGVPPPLQHGSVLFRAA